MKTRKTLVQLALVVACALGAMGIATPKDKEEKRREQAEVREALRRGQVLPLAKILEIATREVPGEVVKVELEFARHKTADGGEAVQRVLIYEIKVLTSQGRVRELAIDARNGAVLKIEDD